jgi:LuxR family transcriptional regulator, quorum-sensing system regulator BjaR1
LIARLIRIKLIALCNRRESLGGSRMDQFLELGDLFTRLSADRSIAAICGSLKQYALRFGFSRMSAFKLTTPVSEFSKALIWSDAPQESLALLDRHGDFSKHPAIVVAHTFRDPFPLSSIPRSDDIDLRRYLGAGSNLDDNAEILIVPVQLGSAAVAIIALMGAQPDLTPLSLDRIKLAVQAAYWRYKQMSANEAQYENQILTPRETECLRWVAAGKTDDDIAAILSITPRTVRFHVDNAKVKLSVATRVQAVAKWLRERPDTAIEQSRAAS